MGADFGFAGLPEGEAEGQDEVVVVAGVGGGLEVHHLLDQAAVFGDGLGDLELLLFEGDVDGGQEVAFGDGVAEVARVRLVSAGDGDGADRAGEFGGADLGEDGLAESAGIDREAAAVGDFGLVGDGAEAFDDGGIGGAEGEAFEVAEVELGGLGGPRVEPVSGLGGDAFDDGEGTKILALTEIQTDMESVGRNGRERRRIGARFRGGRRGR